VQKVAISKRQMEGRKGNWKATMTTLYQIYGLDELFHCETRMGEHLNTVTMGASHVLGAVLIHVEENLRR
jgi:hypothetical protein